MKKHPWYYKLTYIYTWPWDLISWFVILLFWALWGTKLHWQYGLWFEFKKGSWPTRTWYKKWAGSTLGHGGFLAPGYSGKEGMDTSTEFHENVHSKQYEVAMLQSFVLAVFIILFTHACILGGLIWLSGGFLPYCLAMLQAKLRGEAVYYGNILEESAYAQEDLRSK